MKSDAGGMTRLRRLFRASWRRMDHETITKKTKSQITNYKIQDTKLKTKNKKQKTK
jgi:hypothetical protein